MIFADLRVRQHMWQPSASVSSQNQLQLFAVTMWRLPHLLPLRCNCCNCLILHRPTGLTFHSFNMPHGWNSSNLCSAAQVCQHDLRPLSGGKHLLWAARVGNCRSNRQLTSTGVYLQNWHTWNILSKLFGQSEVCRNCFSVSVTLFYLLKSNFPVFSTRKPNDCDVHHNSHKLDV